MYLFWEGELPQTMRHGMFYLNTAVVIPKSSAWDKPTMTSIKYTIFLPFPLRLRTMTITQSLTIFVHMLPFALAVGGGTTAVSCCGGFVSGGNMTTSSLSSFVRFFGSFITKTMYRMPMTLISKQIEINSVRIHINVKWVIINIVELGSCCIYKRKSYREPNISFHLLTYPSFWYKIPEKGSVQIEMIG